MYNKSSFELGTGAGAAGAASNSFCQEPDPNNISRLRSTLLAFHHTRGLKKNENFFKLKILRNNKVSIKNGNVFHVYTAKNILGFERKAVCKPVKGSS
jgi:hypothetical protein